MIVKREPEDFKSITLIIDDEMEAAWLWVLLGIDYRHIYDQARTNGIRLPETRSFLHGGWPRKPLYSEYNNVYDARVERYGSR